LWWDFDRIVVGVRIADSAVDKPVEIANPDIFYFTEKVEPIPVDIPEIHRRTATLEVTGKHNRGIEDVHAPVVLEFGMEEISVVRHDLHSEHVGVVYSIAGVVSNAVLKPAPITELCISALKSSNVRRPANGGPVKGVVDQQCRRAAISRFLVVLSQMAWTSSGRWPAANGEPNRLIEDIVPSSINTINRQFAVTRDMADGAVEKAGAVGKKRS
jgi:hypothetical protein